tara:strand:- start:38 stop:721 length:684 start_codon:yes stop_codon:yes gene_type:complete
MDISTTGIFLHYYKYSDSSVIAKVFTYDQGLKSYVIRGVNSKRTSKKLNLLFPLNILNIESTNNPKKNLQIIKGLSSAEPLRRIYFEMEKKLLCAFVAETLTRILVESNKDQNLYEFIKSTVFEIEFFDDVNKNYAILFLLSLSKHLGFYPTNINSSTTYFDSEFDWGRELNQENIGFLKNLMGNKNHSTPYESRKKILFSLQKYFSANHYNISNLKSYQVIESMRA